MKKVIITLWWFILKVQSKFYDFYLLYWLTWLSWWMGFYVIYFGSLKMMCGIVTVGCLYHIDSIACDVSRWDHQLPPVTNRILEFWSEYFTKWLIGECRMLMTLPSKWFTNYPMAAEITRQTFLYRPTCVFQTTTKLFTALTIQPLVCNRE